MGEKFPFGHLVTDLWLPTGIGSKRLVTGYNAVITVITTITASKSAVSYIIVDLKLDS